MTVVDSARQSAGRGRIFPSATGTLLDTIDVRVLVSSRSWWAPGEVGV